ncbi:MAG: TlpA disulfide reductase family protein [Byssovorax sp.]
MAPPAAPLAAAMLPAIELVTLENRAAGVDSVRAGKVALVTFWAPWCDSCVAELDALNRLDDRARASGGVVIGVAVGETPESTAAFVGAHKMRYPQLVDEDYKLTQALGQRRVPTTLVVDRTGHIVYTGGALDERALAAFRTALGG